MPEYRYELRRGAEVVATGRLSPEQPLETGQQLTIGSKPGTVRSIAPTLRGRELHVVIQLEPDNETGA
jgi:hypothetical protein